MSDNKRNLVGISLGTLAALALIGAMKFAGPVLLPVLTAGLIAVIVQPVVGVLIQKLRVPRVVAIVLTMLLLTGVMVGFGAFLADSVARFADKLPEYQAPLEAQYQAGMAWLLTQGVPQEALGLSEVADPSAILESVRGVLGAVVGVVKNLVVVLLILAFALVESTALAKKAKVAFGDSTATSMGEAALKVQRYIGLKTLMSMGTGVLAGLLCWACGVDFPVVWGFLAFILNFIPNLGSFIAAIPPALLALVAGNWGALGVLVGGYVAINVVVGSVIEPRIMGRRLGLSPLVVFLSLIFWGWMWGPLGMLISVPLTVVVKLILEQNPQTRWVGILLGPVSEAERIEAKEHAAAAETELVQKPASQTG